MSTAAKLSAYGAALALVVAGAYATGTAVGPLSTASGTVTGTAIDQPGGLTSSRGGYTLTPTDPTLIAGNTEDFSFRITGPGAAAVTTFDSEHDKRMHLIVLRRDTTGFQHVHPEMTADGTWSVPLTLPAAGSYRAFADFTPTGGGAHQEGGHR